MFECTLENMTAAPYIGKDEYNIADQNGVELWRGAKAINSKQAIEYINRLDDAIKHGVTHKRTERKLKATRNSIVFAFGPDMEDLVGVI